MRSEKILHLGPHRTGSTSIQALLRENKDVLAESGIDLHAKRRGAPIFSGLDPDQKGRIIVSDENILGPMIECVLQTKIYPDLLEREDWLRNCFSGFDRIALCLRSTVDWWHSVLAFRISLGMPAPDALLAQRICESQRNWGDLISEIIALAPNAKIMIQMMSHEFHDPRRILQNFTDWPEFAKLPSQDQKLNARITRSALIARHLRSGAITKSEGILARDPAPIFDDAQMARLDAAFAQTLQEIKGLPKVHIFEAKKPATRRVSPSLFEAMPLPKAPPLCLINSGGAQAGLKHIFQDQNLKRGVRRLHVSKSLSHAVEMFGPDCKIAFFFDHPLSVLARAFDQNARRTSAREASKFTDWQQIFPNIDDLAESLSHFDKPNFEPAKEYLLELMNRHHRLSFYFHSAEILKNFAENKQIVFCCPINEIEKNRPKIEKITGASPALIAPCHPDLSRDGQSALEDHLADEIEIYEIALGIARQCGFA